MACHPRHPINPARRHRAGTLYLLHFERPWRHAAHYLGWTERPLEERLAEHLKGKPHGSPLVAIAAEQAGISSVEELRRWVVTTKRGDRYEERRLKRRGGHRRVCPRCAAQLTLKLERRGKAR